MSCVNLGSEKTLAQLKEMLFTELFAERFFWLENNHYDSDSANNLVEMKKIKKQKHGFAKWYNSSS